MSTPMIDIFHGGPYILRKELSFYLPDTRMGGMTLQTLLQSYGVSRPADLADILGVDRRYAWALWHGKRRFSTNMALKLYDAKKIPVHELLRAKISKEPIPKGRRPRRGSDERGRS
jgi:transcriptional regulator with XRE-family HTH domain